MENKCPHCGYYKGKEEGGGIGDILLFVFLIGTIESIVIYAAFFMFFGRQIENPESPYNAAVVYLIGGVIFITFLFMRLVTPKKSIECENCGYRWKVRRKLGCFWALLPISILFIGYMLLRIFFLSLVNPPQPITPENIATIYADTPSNIEPIIIPTNTIIPEVENTENAQQDVSLNGIWEGTYNCAQGVTNLRLEILQSNTNEINAVFNFYGQEGDNSATSGSFKMAGTYDHSTKQVSLVGYEWIQSPGGYTTVDLIGTILQENQGSPKMSGTIIGYGCTTFTLDKK